MHRLQIILPGLLVFTCALAAADPAAPAKPLAPPPTLKARGAGDAPAIELAEAVSQSRAYARSNHIDLSKQYLHSANFDFVKRLWKVMWQMPNAKGGCTEFMVPEAGAISVHYGE